MPQSSEGLLTREDILRELHGAFWIIRSTTNPDGNVRPFRLLFVLSLLPLASVFISWLEGTLYLEPTGGRGLMEHLGSWSQFLACPVLIICCLEVFRSVAAVVASRRFIFGESSETLEASSLQKHLVRQIACGTRSGKLRLGLFIFIGFLALIVNVQNTRMAEHIYGEDVWDSSKHVAGYWIGKAFLAFEWVYLIPVLAFVVLAVGFSIFEVVQRMSEAGVRRLAVFSADGCAGFRPLGKTMISILYLNIPAAVIVICLYFTHRNRYPTLILAFTLLVVAVLVELFLPFLRLHTLLQGLRDEKLQRLGDLMESFDAQLSSVANINDPCLALLATSCVYQQTKTINTWPYGRLDALRAITPFLPFVATALKFVL